MLVRRALVWMAAPLCVAGALIVAWAFELSAESVLLLAPLIVLTVAALVGFVLLWVRAFRDSVLRRERD